MTKEFCPKCGKKEFEDSWCSNKWKCNKCGYFLLEGEFEQLKKEKKKNAKA